MKDVGFPYGSLYAYLDDVLAKMDNPSLQLVKQAKRDYWKLYFRHYRKERRQGRREFTLGFDSDALERIDYQRGDLSVSKFLYLAVEHALSDGMTVQPIDRELLSNMHHMLALTVSLLEELLDREQRALTEEVLGHIEQLERLFAECYKNHLL
jgi:glyoxylase-like metal-dependent hydrolase (beta-lactamase superfamily II)